MSRRASERYVVDGKGERVGVILSLDEYERLLEEARGHVPRRRARRPAPRRLDLRALAGRLKWQGDAVAAQRALRDAW